MPKIKSKILLIEDDPDQVFIYQTKFNLEGFNFISAKNGQEGLAAAQTKKPDLILLDMIMAQTNGLEVLQNLKNDSKTKKIPVVLLSNLFKKDLVDKAKNIGALDFWSKTGVLPSELVDRVRKILK
ncbi:MAG: response regulator [Candidatus Buchananbacteria bacterium]